LVIDRRLLAILGLLQVALGALIAIRLARSAGGQRIRDVAEPPPAGEWVAVIVPVLNEVARLGPCLDGLIAQGGEVGQILVVDGGSLDSTSALVRCYADRDPRVQLVEAGPAPPDWNGKAWGLHIGLAHAAAAAGWVLTIDADVRPAARLTRSLLAHARRAGLGVLSVATLQELGGPGEALVHPALLATLIYRYGIPGHARRRVAEVQANGQCFLVRRALLNEIGGFAAVRDSVCEDVTLARALVGAGHGVGFYEAGDLVTCAMYAGGWEAWRNWTRSLPMRDRFTGASSLVGLLEVTVVQALPPLLLPALCRLGAGRWMIAINAALVAMRLGILIGAARAYRRRPWPYWLSPLCDLPAAVQLWWSALRRRHVWRGRTLVRGG
jgi:dolichol-phosphate mannosyltransferase